MTPEEFKAARLKLGMTQQALSDKLGVNIATLQRWEASLSHKSSTEPRLWACRELGRMMKAVEAGNDQSA